MSGLQLTNISVQELRSIFSKATQKKLRYINEIAYSLHYEMCCRAIALPRQCGSIFTTKACDHQP